jgi:ABC-2 type transport system permease protein
MGESVELFLRTIMARAYPRVIGTNRERSWVFFETFLPLLATASYVFFYRAIGAPEDYIGLVIIGGAMTAYWLNVLWSMSAQLHWDKDAGNLALYIAAPTSMMAILLGMALGGLVGTTTRAIVIITAGWLLFGVHFSLTYWGLLMLTFFITMAALYGMGMLFASVYLLWGRGMAYLQPAPGTDFSGFRLLFPRQGTGLLGGGGGLPGAPDAGPGCHAPAPVPGQPLLWLPECPT